MPIFEINKDDLLQLTDELLEELIARLAEAETVKYGGNTSDVEWSGHIKAPDDGIDIRMKFSGSNLEGFLKGFLKRKDIIFQSKIEKMSAEKIKKEMTERNGKLNNAISELAKNKGGYIIVSLKDDCAPPAKDKRIQAMEKEVSSDKNRDQIHLDFFDRSKLLQWLREHVGVKLWVQEKLGKGLSGWKGYGSWSNPPNGTDDELILAPGVTVTLPDLSQQNLLIKDAIEPIRDLIKNSCKAVRINGLSGVGKTRIVQALFDQTVGVNALDRTIAVYVDTGSQP